MSSEMKSLMQVKKRICAFIVPGSSRFNTIISLRYRDFVPRQIGKGGMTMQRKRYTRRKSIRARTTIAALTASFIAGASVAYAQSGLQPNSLNVDGLNYETELTALYFGDFDNARLQNNDIRFLVFMNQYIDAFSRICAASLPKNKVEITESRCVRESTPVNVYGNPVGPTTCSQYQNFGTGRYADPDLYRTANQLEANLTPRAMGDALGLTGGDPIEWSRQMADVALSVGDDMPHLLTRNGCNRAAVKRLQANIQRFADGKAPLRLANGATLASQRSSDGQAFVDSNYRRMVDELIQENARGWSFNRYVAGSASQVSVGRRDSQGRPASLSARYRFSGFGGAQAGSVNISFENGVPKCLYFFDAPRVCRLPSRRVITAYEKGDYRE